MTNVSVAIPAPVAVPRGAVWGAELAARLLSLLSRFMERQAEQAAVSTRSAEAAQVRRLADDLCSVDPRFAADLYAAADRHEST